MLINEIKNNYTQIPNELIADAKISSGAKIVYCYIASKPTGWNVFNKDIQKALNIKQKQTLANYWRELMLSGWVTREMNTVSSNKKTGSYTYTIYGTKNHSMEKPQDTKNNTHSNTKPLNNTKLKEEEEKKPKKKEQPSLDTTAKKIDYDKYMKLWNSFAKEEGLPLIAKMSDKRKARLKKTASGMKDFDIVFNVALEQISQDPFRLGSNDRNWKANFDWLFNEDKMLTLYEEAHNDRN